MDKNYAEWEINEFVEASEQEKLIRTINEQLVPEEARKRVKASNGNANKYYVYGIPKSGGKVIVKDKYGINTVAYRVLLGEFDSQEEAEAFKYALNKRIKNG